MEAPKAVGIDLGTTNSAVAWVDPAGRTAMIRNREGDLLTPSVVLFGDTEVVVGKEARTATTVSPDEVAEWVKRDMGAPVYHQPIRGEYLPPEVIQACILRKLRTDIAHALGPTSRVVITVPAYFDEPRRKATADAGEMAGLNVLDIVNEPVAAALAFGEIEGYLSPGSGKPLADMTVLVYDLGGGTFDVTLLELTAGHIRTMATDGDVQLGGHDWDWRLLNHVADRFQSVHGLDPRQERTSLNRLYNEVMGAKHTLSARRQARIRFQCVGKSSELDVTRDQFDELTANLLERTAYTSRQLIAEAGLGWSRVDRVLLVGGSTRMPMVSRMLQELTGSSPDRTVNPDEAVARGAAIYARYLMTKESGEVEDLEFEVTNVNSHSLGVDGIDPATMRKTNVILIPRNTPLPATFTEKFITKTAGQRSIVVQVLEGESSLPSQCTPIGRTVVDGLPADLPQNWPVEVTFEYAANGRLSVRAVVPGTHRQTTLDLEREVGLSSDGLAGWKQLVASSAGFEAYESMVDDQTSRSGPTADASGASPPAVDCPTDDVPLHTGRASSSASVPSSTGEPVPGDPATGEPGEAGATPSAAPAAGAPSTQVAPSHEPVDRSADNAPAPRDGDRGPQPSPRQPVADGPPSQAPSAAGSGKRALEWRVQAIGFIVSGLIGLLIGYLLVCWLFPEAGFPKFW